MAFFDNGSWSPAAGRQASWEQSGPPSRPGTTPAGTNEESEAFFYQIANVDRAVETWRKSSKMPVDPRVASRHPSVNDFDAMRPQSASNLQSFYATQRYGPRPSDTDQALQAKRRMAAQRERELRNYHQEQQYQKHLSSAKSERSNSPSTGMSEDDRRDLIARQHRALYGAESAKYGNDPSASRPISQDARVTSGSAPGGPRNGSPLAYDPYAMQSGPGNGSESAVTMPSRDGKDGTSGKRSRSNSNASPSSNQNGAQFAFENQLQQSSRASASPPGDSPPRNATTSTTGNVAPIGTRPSAGQQQQGGPAPGLQKRSTTPLPSPLSYGFSNEQGQAEKASRQEDNMRGGWGNSSGVWGGKGSLGVQAKVWG